MLWTINVAGFGGELEPKGKAMLERCVQPMRRRGPKLMGRWSVIAAAAILLAGTARAGESAHDFETLLRDLTALTGELHQLEAAAAGQVEASLQLREKHQAEYDRLDSEIPRLNAQAEAVEEKRVVVRSLCQGAVAEGELEAAQQRCDSALGPFNAQVEAYNQQLESHRTQSADLDRREQDRVNEASALQERLEGLRRKVAAATQAVLEAAKAQCAAAGSTEQGSCFDRANAKVEAVTASVARKSGTTPGN